MPRINRASAARGVELAAAARGVEPPDGVVDAAAARPRRAARGPGGLGVGERAGG